MPKDLATDSVRVLHYNGGYAPVEQDVVVKPGKSVEEAVVDAVREKKVGDAAVPVSSSRLGTLHILCIPIVPECERDDDEDDDDEDDDDEDDDVLTSVDVGVWFANELCPRDVAHLSKTLKTPKDKLPSYADMSNGLGYDLILGALSAMAPDGYEMDDAPELDSEFENVAVDDPRVQLVILDLLYTTPKSEGAKSKPKYQIIKT
jgi:hypothetical protein